MLVLLMFIIFVAIDFSSNLNQSISIRQNPIIQNQTNE